MKIVLVDGDPKEVNELIQGFFGVSNTHNRNTATDAETNAVEAQTTFALPSPNGGRVTVQIVDDSATAQTLQSVKADVTQTRKKQSTLSLERDPAFRLFVQDLQADWDIATIARMLEEVNEETRAVLLTLARSSPTIISYDRAQELTGYAGRVFGSKLVGYGGWCSRNKKRDFIYRNVTQRFYYVPKLIADYILQAATRTVSPTR
jgi:nitrogen fixation protein FixH